MAVNPQGSFELSPVSSNSNEHDTFLRQKRPSSPDPHSRRSTAYLDGIRGLAALVVFFQHFFGYFIADAQHEHGFGQDGKYYYFASFPIIRLLWNGGHAAVVVFFVLSGYVLSAGPLYKIQQRQHASCRRSLLGAIVRRPVRLYLPVLIVNFVFALLLQIPGPLVQPQPWNKPQDSLLQAVAEFCSVSIAYFNPFQVHGSDRFWYPYNISVWTIPIELKGSVLIYTTLFVFAWTFSIGQSSKKAAFIAGALLTFIFLTTLHLNTKWSGAAFTSGILLCLIDTYSLVPTLANKTAHKALYTTLLIVSLYLLSQPSSPGNPSYSTDTPGWSFLSTLIPSTYDKNKYYRYFQTWGSVLLIHSSAHLPSLQTFFASRPLRYLGKISFMLYLIHLPFFRIFPDRLRRMLGDPIPLPWEQGEPEANSWWDNRLWIPDWGPRGLNLRFLVAVAITLPLTMVLADWATRWVDGPCVRLGKRVSSAMGLEGKSREEGTEKERQGPVLPT